MKLEDAHSRLGALRNRLDEIAKRDPTQIVEGMALRVIDSVVDASQPLLKSGDEVGATIRDLIDPTVVASGGEITLRAVDALIVVDQLIFSLRPLPPAEPIRYDVPGGFDNIWDEHW